MVESMSNNIEFKRDIDEQIKDNYKIFEGFDKLSNIDYFYYQDLEKTYIDIGDEDVDPQIEKWIFDHFSWFPEGLYGEVIFFERNSDYEYIGERRRFLIYGHKLDETKINVEGCGWKDLKNYSLYHILEKNLKS